MDHFTKDSAEDIQTARQNKLTMLAGVQEILEKIVTLGTFERNFSEHDIGAIQHLRDLFSDLERIASAMPPSLSDEVVRDVLVADRLPATYAIRSRWESATETLAAKSALNCVDPCSAISSAVGQKIASLAPVFFQELRDRRRILFVGSGPYPTTAMAISLMCNVDVTCLDRNEAANEIGAEFISVGRMSSRLNIVAGDVEEFPDIESFDAVVLAFLVGIGHQTQPMETKDRLVQHLTGRLASNSRLILRTPVFGGRLIYPSVTPPSSDRCLETRLFPSPDKSRVPYDLPFMTIDIAA